MKRSRSPFLCLMAALAWGCSDDSSPGHTPDAGITDSDADTTDGTGETLETEVGTDTETTDTDPGTTDTDETDSPTPTDVTDDEPDAGGDATDTDTPTDTDPDASVDTDGPDDGQPDASVETDTDPDVTDTDPDVTDTDPDVTDTDPNVTDTDPDDTDTDTDDTDNVDAGGTDTDPVTPVSCSAGTWDHDDDDTTECVPHTDCVPGEFVTFAGSVTSDRGCSPCQAQSYSTTTNASRCVSWTMCNQGQTVQTPGSPTSDRVCIGDTTPDCQTGTWDDDDDSSTACVPHTTCVAGQYVESEGTATSDRGCELCASGTYTTAANQKQCKAWTACDPGQFVSVDGSVVRDQTCSSCPAGHYSTETNADSCTAWSTCAAGTYVSNTPSKTQNRVCTSCPGGTTTTAPNQTQCLVTEECEAGTVQVGTDGGFPVCDECSPGEYCAGADAPLVVCGDDTYDDDQDPSTPCIDKTNCAPGQEVTTAGDDVTDRTCADCADGTYSSEENAEVCVVWTECTAAQFEEQAGTDTTDAVCTDLEVLQVVTGAQHTCVRLNDGHVRCWGAGGQGQLGYGDAADRNAPPAENVGGLGFVTHLAAGENHTCAILQNSRVRCWGAGGDGQLGYGDDQNKLSPGGNLTLSNAAELGQPLLAVELAAGASHTCALGVAGDVRCWGSNGVGQLGYPEAEAVGELLQPASNLLNYYTEDDASVQISSAALTSCLLFDDGAVRCWGFSLSGEAGVILASGFRTELTDDLDFGGDLAVSIESMGGHSCALMSDDSLRCWGWGNSGRLGYNSEHNVPSTDSPLPMNNNVNLGVGETAATVGVGSGHTCAWLVDGGLRCWGVAGSGQLGYGAPLVNVGDGIGPSIVAAGDVPLTLGAGVSVTQIAAGGDDWGGHTCVLQSDGNVQCWGRGDAGQLGYGNENSRSTPGGPLTLFPEP